MAGFFGSKSDEELLLAFSSPALGKESNNIDMSYSPTMFFNERCKLQRIDFDGLDDFPSPAITGLRSSNVSPPIGPNKRAASMVANCDGDMYVTCSRY